MPQSDITLNIEALIFWLGAVFVFISGTIRFNNPQIMSTDHIGWTDNLIHLIKPKKHEGLKLTPPRANTTALHYRLHQTVYGLTAVCIYFGITYYSPALEIINTVLGWFNVEFELDPIKLDKSGPLAIAMLVIFVLPYLPPFRWADIVYRAKLYEFALIPAQQIRESHRLHIAHYSPSAPLIENVQEHSIAEGYHPEDIQYDPHHLTTQSLWGKCLLLISNLQAWQADEHYKTAFASLKEGHTKERSIDAIHQLKEALSHDARVYFAQLRDPELRNTEAFYKRETAFRSACNGLLTKIFTLFAGVSLHSHFSEFERINKFSKIGIQLKPASKTAIPDSNDLIMITLILSLLIVLPIAQVEGMGLIKGLKIGLIILGCILSPLIIANYFPSISQRKHSYHGINVTYPLLSGLLAAFIAFALNMLETNYLTTPSMSCGHLGLARYTHCLYPWSFIHGAVAAAIA